MPDIRLVLWSKESVIIISCEGGLVGWRPVLDSAVKVFSPWNQMAEALSTAASICAVMAFGCSSVPAVLSFPQAVSNVAATNVAENMNVVVNEIAIVDKLTNAATAVDKIFPSFIILSPILCPSAGTVASWDGKLGQFFCIRWQVR